MQKALFSLLISISLAVSGQIEVNNPTPDVFLDSRKYLYSDTENPVVITTGKLKSVKVSMINGTIKKTDVPGKYLATPDESSFSSTIILTAKKYREEFYFDHKELPRPKAVFAGLRNEDGVILFFKSTTGVVAIIENFPIQVNFSVDSFTITFSDSVSEKTHKNIGPHWDSTTQKMLKDAKRKTTITIQDIYVSCLRRRYFLPEKLMGYIF